MPSLSVPARCRCGQLRFVLAEEPISFYLCHCTDCQAESGSAFGQTMHVRAEAVTGIEGEFGEHLLVGPHGQQVVMRHCPSCLTSMWAGQKAIPQVLGVNAGSLEDAAGLTPYGNMWTRSARPWVAFAPGPRFETQPEDRLAMIKAWAERPRA